ncbi:MAG: GPW/gp25 family protein [Bacteroides sp.]
MNELKDFSNSDAFLGRGWSFPPTITDEGIQMSAYELDIKESLHILFSTSPGERVNRNDYGCPLRLYAFEPMTTETTVQMRGDITRAILLFEPRITLEDVSFEMNPTDGLLLIQLTYTIIRTNNRNNMVYPFYFNEGTTSSV